MIQKKDSRLESKVVITGGGADVSYPSLDQTPFHPAERYPEYGEGPLSAKPNLVYEMVRNTWAELALDRARFGKPGWNPLGDLIQPGARVVIKPNWVYHANQGAGGLACLITHPSILRAVLDYVLLASPSDVLVGDAPIQDCDFQKLLSHGIRSVLEYFKNLGAPVRWADFRRTVLRQDGFSLDVKEGLHPLEEYVTVDLGSQSLLETISQDAKRFRVTKYDPRKMTENHRLGRHCYLVAKDILQADLVINLPKLKTHKKAGVTAALKNLVGINGNKDYLPHHRKGAAASGDGDCYEKTSLLKAATEHLLDLANMNLHRPCFLRLCNRLAYYMLVLDMKLGGPGDVEGSWYGNDTIWRTCLDLNRLLLYADKDGCMQETPQRGVLSLVDALIAGEGDGPLKPNPRNLGVFLASFNSAACDWVSALLMGFDPAKIPLIQHAFDADNHPISLCSPETILYSVNGQEMNKRQVTEQYGQQFKPPAGWVGHCEFPFNKLGKAI